MHSVLYWQQRPDAELWQAEQWRVCQSGNDYLYTAKPRLLWGHLHGWSRHCILPSWNNDWDYFIYHTGESIFYLLHFRNILRLIIPSAKLLCWSFLTTTWIWPHQASFAEQPFHRLTRPQWTVQSLKMPLWLFLTGRYIFPNPIVLPHFQKLVCWRESIPQVVVKTSTYG